MCIPNLQRLTEEASIFWFDLCGWRLTEDHTLKMIYTRRKVRADTNPEYPSIIQHKINMHDVRTSSWTVFTPEQNKLIVHQVVQES